MLAHHFPIGQLARSSLVFKFIKQPHLRHCSVLGLKNSQVRQIESRYSTISSWLRGSLGFNISQGLTSI